MIALLENNPRALQSNSAAVSRRFSDGNVLLNGRRTARKAKARPTIEELREYLDYDPETGVLRWKKVHGKSKVGQVAGSRAWSTRGSYYWKISFKRQTVWAHRAAFAFIHGRWPHPCCDHVDGNGLNNRADNLRECSLSQNQHNKGASRTNSTGVKGVSRGSKGGYEAHVSAFGRKHRKYFRRLEDAAAYVKQLREQLHGEFARHE